jgi:hypothetical protein
MKTWVRLYDANGQKYTKDYTLHGRWSLKAIQAFINRRPWLNNPDIQIKYL